MTGTETATSTLARQLRDMVVKRQEYSCEAVRAKLDEWAERPGMSVDELVSVGNANGKTALHFAAQLRSDGSVELLLERGADVQSITARGHTPLIFAAGRARDSVVRSLLQARASCRVRTANGDTALEMAAGRCLPETVEVMERAEAAEACAWRDFTEDERAIAAQADHVEKNTNWACWQGDIPASVADVLARRERDRERSSASASAEQDAEVSELAKQFGELWCDDRQLAALLLQRAVGRRRRQVVPMLRGALLMAGRAPSEEDDVDRAAAGAQRAAVLARIVGEVLPQAARAIARDPNRVEGSGVPAGARGERNSAELGDADGSVCSHFGGASHDARGQAAKGSAKESRRTKEARMMVVSSVLGALKELVPETGMSVGDFAACAPPWMSMEVFAQAGAADLVKDGAALRSVLRRVCHESAWGSDFGAALRWLRGLRPAPDAKASSLSAFEELAREFVAVTLAAVESGHSLRSHIRDSQGLIEEIRQTLGAQLAAPVLERCMANSEDSLGCIAAPLPPQAIPTESVPFMLLPKGVPVLFVDSTSTWATAQAVVRSSRLLALDTEWWDSGRGPALVQVAVGDELGNCKVCLLLDTLKAPELFAPVLMKWAEQEDLEILGWSFGEDHKRLQELFVEHGGGDANLPHVRVVDLQPPSCKLLGAPGLVSLSKACGHLLGRSLDKAEQCSDWNRRPLTEAQATYAALDACALLALRGELLRRGALPSMRPPAGAALN